uniref:Neutral ceramidase n=1 Tax=Lotharella globosa TaxID=91324 RepID=A0A6V3PGQ6_9EUKA
MLAMVSFLFPILMALGAGASRKSTTGEFLVGVGKADITGPAADVNLCGYEYLNQTAKGIHLRLLARTLIVSGTEEGAKRVAFVSIDTGMPSQLATKVIVETLAKKLGPGVYTERNLLISSTHTHSTPGGWQQYLLFQVSSLGFVQEAFDAVVSGVVRSVVRAHMALQPGSLSLNSGLLAGANINRSPPAYVRNPSEERKRYETVGNDTDHIMQLLRVDATDGSPLGMFNWFAVHGTSMNHSNDLLSGDNKGYASYQFERAIAAQQGRSQAFNSSDGGFVAAFASTNLGDVSPNTLGAFCQDSGLPCDPIHSTCHGKNELCIGRGPGRDQFESTQIIGQKQTDKAMDLWKTASTEVSGGVDFRHTYLRMPGLKVHLNETHSVGLCKPAMGYSFAAGTTDGPGMFNFIQSSNSSNPFWNIISHAIAKPSKEQIACQAPKPILIDSGDASWPYGWDPEIVPIQILRIGQLAILGVPGEFTTMAGRRLREAMTSTLEDEGLIPKGEAVAVVAGLSNT